MQIKTKKAGVPASNCRVRRRSSARIAGCASDSPPALAGAAAEAPAETAFHHAGFVHPGDGGRDFEGGRFLPAGENFVG